MPSGMKDQDPTSSEEVDNPAEEADDLAHIALAVHLSQLSMDAVEDRFFGQSRYRTCSIAQFTAITSS